MHKDIVSLFEAAATAAEAIEAEFAPRFAAAKTVPASEINRAHAALRSERGARKSALAAQVSAQAEEAQRLLSLVSEEEQDEVGARLETAVERFDKVMGGFAGIYGIRGLLGV